MGNHINLLISSAAKKNYHAHQQVEQLGVSNHEQNMHSTVNNHDQLSSHDDAANVYEKDLQQVLIDSNHYENNHRLSFIRKKDFQAAKLKKRLESRKVTNQNTLNNKKLLPKLNKLNNFQKSLINFNIECENDNDYDNHEIDTWLSNNNRNKKSLIRQKSSRSTFNYGTDTIVGLKQLTSMAESQLEIEQYRKKIKQQNNLSKRLAARYQSNSEWLLTSSDDENDDIMNDESNQIFYTSSSNDANDDANDNL